MEDLEYIKKFSKITIRDVCKKANVDYSNLYRGNCSKKNIKKVRRQLENDVAELYLLINNIEVKNDKKN